MCRTYSWECECERVFFGVRLLHYSFTSEFFAINITPSFLNWLAFNWFCLNKANAQASQQQINGQFHFNCLSIHKVATIEYSIQTDLRMLLELPFIYNFEMLHRDIFSVTMVLKCYQCLDYSKYQLHNDRFQSKVSFCCFFCQVFLSSSAIKIPFSSVWSEINMSIVVLIYRNWLKL